MDHSVVKEKAGGIYVLTNKIHKNPKNMKMHRN